LAFDAGICGFKDFNLVYGEGNACVFATFAVASLLELEGDSRCLGGDCTQFDQALGGGKLTIFESETLQLQQAPQLLDGPALLVPMNDAPSRHNVGNIVGGEQPPVQGLDAVRRT